MTQVSLLALSKLNAVERSEMQFNAFGVELLVAEVLTRVSKANASL